MPSGTLLDAERRDHAHVSSACAQLLRAASRELPLRVSSAAPGYAALLASGAWQRLLDTASRRRLKLPDLWVRIDERFVGIDHEAVAERRTDLAVCFRWEAGRSLRLLHEHETSWYRCTRDAARFADFASLAKALRLTIVPKGVEYYSQLGAAANRARARRTERACVVLCVRWLLGVVEQGRTVELAASVLADEARWRGAAPGGGTRLPVVAGAATATAGRLRPPVPRRG